MIIILKEGVSANAVDNILGKIKDAGLNTHMSVGASKHIIGVIGDTTKINVGQLMTQEGVEDIRRVSEPFKTVNRKFHPNDTHIAVGNGFIGEGFFSVMAGPCSVESEEQIIEIAKSVKASGATCLRGGAYKPRTSPYAFQGLKSEGIRLLLEAKKITGLPIVTEIMSASVLDDFADVDVIQVGARNMQNFDLLSELGHSKKPILLKRGLSSTMEELLMSAEYIASGGNENIILCERGIRTFENYTRNTLDISAVAMLKRLTHLPIIIDPSHATGKSYLVSPLVKSAISIGADGVIVEVHNNPPMALCDGAQSLTPSEFDELMKDVKRRVEFEGKKI